MLKTKKYQALQDGDSWDFSCNKLPKCPHCGNDFNIDEREAWELYEDDRHKVECDLCQHSFFVETNITYSFSTDDQLEEDSY